MEKRENLLREPIRGSRTLGNFLITLILYLAGISFVLAGLSSFLNKQLLPFTDTTKLDFLPQGIVMIFYGFLAIIVAIFLTAGIVWNVGSGYNEFSKTDNLIRIVRRNFPGQNKIVFLTYPINTVKKIKVDFKQGLNPRNNIYLILQDNREIPLYSSQRYVNISIIEEKAITLAQFINVPLENNYQSLNV